MEFLLGLLLVTLAGLGTGTVAWPIKFIKGFQFELFLFYFMVTGVIVYPWIIVFINIPDPLKIINTIGWKSVLISNLLSMCWGVASILYLRCVVQIGAALTGAILSSVGISVGVLIPMIFKGSGLFSNAPGLMSNAGLLIILGLAIIIIGVVLVSFAGLRREKEILKKNEHKGTTVKSGSFVKNLMLLILAGILSSGISLVFVYSQGPIIEAAKLQGAGEITANITVWALGMFGGGLACIIYTFHFLLTQNSIKLMYQKKGEALYGILIGLQFIGAIVLMGRGMVLLGALGASVGFAIQQSMQIIGNQLIGFIGGEWKGVDDSIKNTMTKAIVILLIAIMILAYSNSIAT